MLISFDLIFPNLDYAYLNAQNVFRKMSRPINFHQQIKKKKSFVAGILVTLPMKIDVYEISEPNGLYCCAY